MSDDLKIVGIVKKVNNNGILLQTRDDIEGKWYNGVGKVIDFIKPELRGSEVEITLQNIEKHIFTFLTIKKEQPQIIEGVKNDSVSKQEEEKRRYRAMAISYSKDLVIAEKISESEMVSIADGIFFYILTGERKQ
jgi:hypothetical protein